MASIRSFKSALVRVLTWIYDKAAFISNAYVAFVGLPAFAQPGDTLFLVLTFWMFGFSYRRVAYRRLLG